MEADLIGSLREALIAYAVRMSGNHNLSRAAVRECFPLLLALKAERVSDAKVAGVFNAVGFAISSTTLNRYVRDERAAMGDSPETTRRASPKQATSRRTTAMAQIEVYA
jgi:hypothetical protein